MTKTSSTYRHDLLQAAQLGEIESLGQLLHAYRNYLSVLAVTQIDRRLRARVSPSDVVQETLLEAHRDFIGFRGQSEGEFIGWLRQILVNNLARAVEKHLVAGKRDLRLEVSMDRTRRSVERSGVVLAHLLADDGRSPGSDAQHREHALILADVLAELPDDYREVIVLRNLESFSFDEVADRMGRSSGAVRMLWLRAIEQMRGRLESRKIL